MLVITWGYFRPTVATLISCLPKCCLTALLVVHSEVGARARIWFLADILQFVFDECLALSTKQCLRYKSGAGLNAWQGWRHTLWPMMTSFRSTILTAHAPEQWLINLPDRDFTTAGSSCLRLWCGSRVPTGSLTGSGTELSSVILLVLIGRVVTQSLYSQETRCVTKLFIYNRCPTWQILSS